MGVLRFFLVHPPLPPSLQGGEILGRVTKESIIE